MSKKVLSLEEVSLHTSSKDCWIIVHNKVYDVTSYLEDHPGGDDVILQATAKDATDDFEDAGHGSDARTLMEKYYIGDVDLNGNEGKQPNKFYSLFKEHDLLIKVLPAVAVPLIILGLVIVVRNLRTLKNSHD